MITVREGVGILHMPCEILSMGFFFLELSGSITGTCHSILQVITMNYQVEAKVLVQVTNNDENN